MFQTINQIKSAVGNKQIGSKDTTNVPRKKKRILLPRKTEWSNTRTGFEQGQGNIGHGRISGPIF